MPDGDRESDRLVKHLFDAAEQQDFSKRRRELVNFVRDKLVSAHSIALLNRDRFAYRASVENVVFALWPLSVSICAGRAVLILTSFAGSILTLSHEEGRDEKPTSDKATIQKAFSGGVGIRHFRETDESSRLNSP